MSKVATRTATTTTSTAAAPMPSTTARRGPRAYPAQDYTVQMMERDGVQTEVIVIEDTPPIAGPSRARAASIGRHAARPNSGSGGAGPAYASTASSGQPPSRKRKKDDEPLGTSSNSRLGPYEGYADPAPSKKVRSAQTTTTPRQSGSHHEPPPQIKAPVPALPVQDKEGHFIVRVGDVLAHRYRIIKPLGQGTFGKVVCAWDAHKLVEVAVKVIRAVPKYREASKIEIKVLEHLKRHDPTNRFKCIHLLHVFDYQNHVCLVSELLAASVFDFLKENQYAPFPFSQIQSFAAQLLGSVSFLHSLKLIHTDLKPENILLVDASSVTITSKSSRAAIKSRKVLLNDDIRLIDFGSATFEEEYHASVVSTRHYRAPEIILGMSWSYPCDVWSIGCILIEFYTGEALFQTHENVEHLAMMRQVFGEMPVAFARRAARAKPGWFVPGTRGGSSRELYYPNTETTKQSKKFVKQMRPLAQIINPAKVEHQHFLDLLRQLLQWDPDDRITVDEALDHPFFGTELSDVGNTPHT